MAHRNAASVFPDPVGAEISTCSPDAIAGHAWACAGVGSVNAAENHSRVLGVNSSRDISAERSEPGRPVSALQGPDLTAFAARSNTASIIGSVSFPVNVFCWLGW